MGPSPTLVGNRRKFTSRLIVNHLSRNNAEFSQPLRSFGTAAAPFLLDEPIRVASEKALAAKAVLKAKVGRSLHQFESRDSKREALSEEAPKATR